MEKLLVFGYTMEMGGAEKSLLDVLNFLSNKYEIDLYLLTKKGSLLSSLSKKVNVFELKKNKIFYILFRYIPFFRKIKINKIANRKDYHYAIGYLEGRSATWVSDIKKTIVKYAWIHCDVSKLDIGIKEKEIKKSYNNLNKIIFVSEEAMQKFCNKYEINSKKTIVINNFINEKEIIKKSKEIIINNKVVTFTNVAKMRDEKRQDRLINAAEYLKNKNYEFKIQLIGDGPNLDKIIKLIEEKDLKNYVELLGLKCNPYPYIKNCDYFILPSENEGYGIVVKEALTLRKKIISTDTIGPREILENGKYGIIVNNTDNAVIEIMESILKGTNVFKNIEKSLVNYKGNDEKIKNKLLQLFEGEQNGKKKI